MNYLSFMEKEDFESILTNPILDIAARVWDKDRYEAFRVCYRSMRIVDDLVDDRKATGEPISNEEQLQLQQLINNWLDHFKDSKPIDEFQSQLIEVRDKYKIPNFPWIRLSKAMVYDLNHDGFKSFLTFRRYSEGAAIAPASIFMHLCAIQNNNGQISSPPFDICQAARPLALFAYLVHIMRDFEKDHKSNLNYYADNLLAKHYLSRPALLAIAKGDTITDSFRNLMGDYKKLAGYYKTKARNKLNRIQNQLDSKYQLSLELIFELYDQIYDRIDPENGTFTTSALNPTPAEIKNKIQSTIEKFNQK